MAFFTRIIGIDYSGAQTPTASLPGLRIYRAEGDAPPVEVAPPPGPRKYWSRRGIAEWLMERLSEDAPTTPARSSASRRQRALPVRAEPLPIDPSRTKAT
jgi:hypothetical protein